MFDRIKLVLYSISPIKAEMIATTLLLLMALLLVFIGCTPAQPRTPDTPIAIVVNCYAESGHQTVIDTIKIDKPSGWRETIEQNDAGITIRNGVDIVAVYTGHCTARKITVERIF